MRTELLRLLCTAATLLGGLPSQNVTVPAPLNGVEGGGGTNVPFGSNLACRYQVIYDAAELPWSGPRLINGISLRADNGSPLAALASLPSPPGTAIAAKQYLDVSVLISTSYKTSATVSGTFEDNYGTDARWVLSYARIALPAQPVLPVGPRPANIDLLFTTPWYYGLTPARPGQPAPDSLLIELWVHAQPSGTYRLDNLGGCVAPANDFGNQGPLCTVPGAAGVPTLATDPSMLAGSSFTWTLTNAPANAPFLLAVNLTNQGFLYGNPAFPLPVPLFNLQNPNLPPPIPGILWPAPDCWLNIDPISTFFGVSDTTGRGVVSVVLPTGRQQVGTTYFAQGVVMAPTANPLQIVTTRGRQSTICGPLGVARVYAFYNGSTVPPPAPPAAGAVQYGFGLVLEVR